MERKRIFYIDEKKDSTVWEEFKKVFGVRGDKNSFFDRVLVFSSFQKALESIGSVSDQYLILLVIRSFSSPMALHDFVGSVRSLPNFSGKIVFYGKSVDIACAMRRYPALEGMAFFVFENSRGLMTEPEIRIFLEEF